MNWRQKSDQKFGKKSGPTSGDLLGFIPFVVPFRLVLQDGRNPWSRRGGGRVGRDWPSPRAPALPPHGGRFVRRLPIFIWGVRHFLAGRLGGLHEVSPGWRWSTNWRGPGVGKVLELPGPTLRRKLGSDGLVRVRRGAIVRTAGNPGRVARPRGGAEGGVRSGNGYLATNCFPGAG